MSRCVQALLRLRNDRKLPPLVPASFAQQTPRVGDSIFVIGYPLFFPTTGMHSSLCTHVRYAAWPSLNARMVCCGGTGQGCVCTGGKVAKVVMTTNGKPGVIQTTAAVHNGNSGGALINKYVLFPSHLVALSAHALTRTRISAGRVVGMVTCNMRRKGSEDEAASSGVIIPRLNFSIPVHLLGPVLSFVSDPSSGWWWRERALRVVYVRACTVDRCLR
jgi:hypothetical protein